MDIRDMMIDASRMRALREVRGWSQEHLAAVSGLSARTIQRLEAEGRASPESRMAVAAAFGVDAAALVSEDGIVPTGVPMPVNPHLTPPTSPPADRTMPTLVVGIAIIVLLMAIFGYKMGKDAAIRDNALDGSCESGECGRVNTQ